MTSGSTEPRTQTPPAAAIIGTNPANTFSTRWPARILAQRRTAWESGREKNEMISISTTNQRMYQGTPEGTNSLKNLKPFLAKPTTMTVKNTISAMVAVMTIWLVGVKK